MYPSMELDLYPPLPGLPPRHLHTILLPMNPHPIHRIFPLALLLLSLLSFPARAGLDALVDTPTFFTTTADTVESAAGQRGEWLDAPDSRTLRLRRPLYRGAPVAEALARYTPSGEPVRLQVLLYSRGDDGPSPGRAFVERLEPVRAHLDTLAGAPGRRRNVPANSRLVELRSWEWPTPRAIYRLDVASQGRASELRGEFIRLWVLPPDDTSPAPSSVRQSPSAARASATAPALARTTRRDTLKKADLLANVVREGTRTTLANIPMVDQGDKGYCAAATMARLLDYFGLGSMDQHELAAAMSTDSAGGTSSVALKQAMSECGRKFGLRLAEIDDLDLHDYERLVKAYNQAARHHGVARIENHSGLPIAGEAFWVLADGETLREARAETPQKQRAWLKKIRDHVDSGIPVVWSVCCGLVPEPGNVTVTRGGHLRLIVGYDEANSLVYFSDTWGPGHECKPMPLADAIAITRSRFVILPKW